MLDRTIAPAIQQIEQVSIPEAVSVELDNNIPLFYVNAGKQPVMRLEIIFKSGKWHERVQGHSYFTGKMLTEGTEYYSAAEIAAYFDELGAFVEVRCGFDRVTLTIHLLTRQLKALLPLIKEMICAPSFSDTELESLKAREKQKLLIDLEKNNVLATRNFTEKIFGGQHPYGRVLSLDNIDNINTEAVSSFFHQQMEGNFEIVLSGQIKEEYIDTVNNLLGKITRKNTDTQVITTADYVPSKHLIEKAGSLQSSIRLGMPFIDRKHPDYLEMLVVNEILGGYFGSRLMRNIREDKGYTYGIRSNISCLSHAALWVVSTDVKKQYREQTLEEISKEILTLHVEPVPDKELQTVKNYMLGTFVSSLDTPFALADKFKTIHYSGLSYDYFQRYFDTIRNISSNRIQKLSKQYLLPENLTTIAVG